MRKFSFTLKTTLILGLWIGLVVPFLLGSWFTYSRQREVLQEDLKFYHNQITNTVAISVSEPLWAFSEDFVAPTIDSVMRDDRVVRVLIKTNSRDFLERSQPSRAVGVTQKLNMPILRGKEIIGSVEVVISAHKLDDALKVNFAYLLITALLQLASSALIIILLMNNRVLAPLQRLIDQAGRISRKELELPFEWKRLDELGRLGTALDNTRISLRTLFDEIEAKNVLLQNHIRHLNTLGKRMETILLATRNLATARDVISAAQIASKHALDSLDLGNDSSIILDMECPPKYASGIPLVTRWNIFRQGTACLDAEVNLSLDNMSESDHVNSAQTDTYVDAKGILRCPIISNKGKVGVLSISGNFGANFSHEELQFINTLMASLSISLGNISYVKNMEFGAKLEVELQAARTVQESLLPREISIVGIEAAAYFQPATQTGGDWYGYYLDAASEVFYFCLGDVTGHGIPAALVTGVACGGFYSGEMRADLLRPDSAPDPRKRLLQMAEVSNLLIGQVGAGEKCMTMAYFALNLVTGQLFYLNAGHNFPILISALDGKLKTLTNRGSRLGFQSKGNFEVKEYLLAEDDILFVYSDGLVENQGPNGELFSIKALQASLRKKLELQKMTQDIIDGARFVWKENSLEDDVTFLAIRWQGKKHPCASEEIQYHDVDHLIPASI